MEVHQTHGTLEQSLEFHNHDYSIRSRWDVFLKRVKYLFMSSLLASVIFLQFPTCPPTPFQFLQTNRWHSCTWLHCWQYWVDHRIEFPLFSSISWSIPTDHCCLSSQELALYLFLQGEPLFSLLNRKMSLEKIHVWWKAYGISRLNRCQCWQSWQLLSGWQVWQLLSVWQVLTGLLGLTAVTRFVVVIVLVLCNA